MKLFGLLLSATLLPLSLIAQEGKKAREDSPGDPAREQELSLSASDVIPPYLELPHIRQKSGTSYCGPTVVLTAYQRQTGLVLDNPIIVPRLASMVMESAGHPNFGLATDCLWGPLNLSFECFNFSENLNITDVNDAGKLALTTLRKDIIPALQEGAYFSFGITSSHPRGHAVLVTRYDAKTDKLTVHDPLRSRVSEITVPELAKIWPLRRPSQKHFALRTEKLLFPVGSELRTPPTNACVNISAEALGKLQIPDVLTPEMLNWAEGTPRLGQHTDWKRLSKFWQNRDPQKVIGVADVARIKVAQGEPPLMVFDNGEGNLEVVVVSGYRGGYCNPKGEIQLSVLNEGRLVGKWMSVSDFLLKCSPRQGDGEYGCYIGYPQTSLRDPRQSLASIGTDPVSPASLDGNGLQEVEGSSVRPAPDFIIEGESLVGNAKSDSGRVFAQRLKGKERILSGGQHLFWKGANPGDVLTFQVIHKDLPSGVYDLAVFPTTAFDYAKVKVTIDGEEQEADLYSIPLALGKPLCFSQVTVRPGYTPQVQIQIMDKNVKAHPERFFVGIDRIELTRSRSSEADRSTF